MQKSSAITILRWGLWAASFTATFLLFVVAHAQTIKTEIIYEQPDNSSSTTFQTINSAIALNAGTFYFAIPHEDLVGFTRIRKVRYEFQLSGYNACAGSPPSDEYIRVSMFDTSDSDPIQSFPLFASTTTNDGTRTFYDFIFDFDLSKVQGDILVRLTSGLDSNPCPEDSFFRVFHNATGTLPYVVVFGEDNDLRQFHAGGTSVLPEGGVTSNDEIVFGGTLQSDNANLLQLQVEVRRDDAAFTDQPNATSDFVPSGSFVTTTIPGLPTGSYHWQARVVEQGTGTSSDWAEFVHPGNRDFTVHTAALTGNQIGNPYFNATTTSPISNIDCQTFIGAGQTINKLILKYEINPAVGSGQQFGVHLYENTDQTGETCGEFGQWLFYTATTTKNLPGIQGVIFDLPNIALEEDVQYVWRVGITNNGGFLAGTTFDSYGDGKYANARGLSDLYFAYGHGGDINVAVILAEPSDAPHESGPITTQPCKLLPEKTYQNGYDKEYFNDLAFCVTDYYAENSYGAINLNFSIFNNGAWLPLSTSSDSYVSRENLMVTDAVQLSGIGAFTYDVIVVIHSGGEGSLRNMTWKPQFQPLGAPPYKVTISEMNFIGSWAHEIGHVLGALTLPGQTVLPDMYASGEHPDLELGGWDIMARGSRIEGGKNPTAITSYLREFLGWLNYDHNVHSKNAFGNYTIDSIDSSNFGDSIFRYNLEDSTSTLVDKYYIVEARNRNFSTWGSSLPVEKALVIYYVDERGLPEYGYDPLGVPWQHKRIVQIPGIKTGDGILIPGDGRKYFDIDNLVKISTISDNLRSHTKKTK